MVLLTVLLIGGFLMMAGTANKYTEFDEGMFSFRRITLSPLIIMASYIGFIWLILKKPSE